MELVSIHFLPTYKQLANIAYLFSRYLSAVISKIFVPGIVIGASVAFIVIVTIVVAWMFYFRNRYNKET